VNADLALFHLVPIPIHLIRAAIPENHIRLDLAHRVLRLLDIVEDAEVQAENAATDLPIDTVLTVVTGKFRSF
jgi:hypothetical protein